MIKFGTSGWRAIIAEEFTYENVRLVTQAIIDQLMEMGIAGQGIVIGYDTRFLSEKFADSAADVCAANKIPAYVTERDTPTPVIAYEIIRRKAAGGINFTASHNPPEYNGLKFSPASGGAAPPEMTTAVEENYVRLRKKGDPPKATEEQAAKYIEKYDPSHDYLHNMVKMIDVEKIREAGLKICLDPLYGTARGYLDKLLTDMGVEVFSVHDWRDPYFGGHSPEPGPKQLEALTAMVKEKNADLGLSTDGDADRFGVVDRDGTFIEANYVLAVLLDHLLATRQWEGAVVRSIATTHFLDAIAEAQNYEVIETPVGFKYIAQVMETGPIILGGEESAGMTVHDYIPEKDGILACLLVAEMVATRKQSVGEILEGLYETHGRFVTARKNLKLTDEIKEKLMKTLKENTPEIIGDQKVIEVSLKEGVKTILSDGSWVMFRPSGTEPIVRCYVEGKSEEQVGTLLADCQAIVDTL